MMTLFFHLTIFTYNENKKKLSILKNLNKNVAQDKYAKNNLIHTKKCRK